MTKVSICTTIIASLLLAACPQAICDDGLLSPAAVANRNPLVQITGLPPTRNATVAATGSKVFSISAEISNSFRLANSDQEFLNLDIESYRTEFGFRYGSSDGWEFGVRIPYIAHSGGFLDAPIETFHDVFGLPNGGREEFDQDEIQLRIADTYGTDFSIYSARESFGDAMVDFAYQLPGTSVSKRALRFGFKAPTGNSGDLTGSGSVDAFASLNYSRFELAGNPAFNIHLNAGVLLMGTSTVLESRQRSSAWFGGAALAWRIKERFALKLQLDAHTAIYHSDLKELGDGSLQLAFGGAANLTKKLQFELMLVEDIHVGSSPDIVISAGLRWRPE